MSSQNSAISPGDASTVEVISQVIAEPTNLYINPDIHVKPTIINQALEDLICNQVGEECSVWLA